MFEVDLLMCFVTCRAVPVQSPTFSFQRIASCSAVILTECARVRKEWENCTG